MISSDKGFVRISGSADEIMTEFTGIIKAVRDALGRHMPQEHVDELIAMAGRMAYAEGPDDLIELLMDEMESERES